MDTTLRREYFSTPTVLKLYFVLATLAAVACGHFFLFHTPNGIDEEIAHFLLPPLGIGLAAAASFWGWSLARSRYPSIVVSPEGFFDTRQTAHGVPWPSITDIRLEEGGVSEGQVSVLILDLDPEMSRALRRVGPMRLAPRKSLWVGTLGMPTDVFYLKETCMAYWHAYRGNVEATSV